MCLAVYIATQFDFDLNQYFIRMYHRRRCGRGRHQTKCTHTSRGEGSGTAVSVRSVVGGNMRDVYDFMTVEYIVFT